MNQKIISEIIKISVKPGFDFASATFAKLREASVAGGAREQYYGFEHVQGDGSLASATVAKLREASVAGGAREQYSGFEHVQGDSRNFCWVIQWPSSAGPLQTDTFRDALAQLDERGKPASWLVPFDDASQPRRALVAPCAQLCTVPLKPGTDMTVVAQSLHKTYSDCYEAPGFTGGYWGTALNDKLVNWYYLGWESQAQHDAYAETPLFWEEINRLTPYMSGGDSGFYTFTQQLDE